MQDSGPYNPAIAHGSLQSPGYTRSLPRAYDDAMEHCFAPDYMFDPEWYAAIAKEDLNKPPMEYQKASKRKLEEAEDLSSERSSEPPVTSFEQVPQRPRPTTFAQSLKERAKSIYGRVRKAIANKLLPPKPAVPPPNVTAALYTSPAKRIRVIPGQWPVAEDAIISAEEMNFEQDDTSGFDEMRGVSASRSISPHEHPVTMHRIQESRMRRARILAAKNTDKTTRPQAKGISIAKAFVITSSGGSPIRNAPIAMPANVGGGHGPDSVNHTHAMKPEYRETRKDAGDSSSSDTSEDDELSGRTGFAKANLARQNRRFNNALNGRRLLRFPKKETTRRSSFTEKQASFDDAAPRAFRRRSVEERPASLEDFLERHFNAPDPLSEMLSRSRNGEALESDDELLEATRQLELSDLRKQKRAERIRKEKELEEERKALEERRIAEQKAAEEAARRAEEAKKKAAAAARRLIKQISPEWKKKVAEVGMLGDVMETVTPAGVSPLTAHDFTTLLDEYGSGMGWLNDEIVNNFLSHLVKRAQEKRGYTDSDKKAGRAPPFHAFNSAWHKTFETKGAQGITGWTRRAKLPGKKILEAEHVFFPICTHNHWTLLVVSPKARHIEYYDSLHGSGERAIKFARQWLAFELKDAYKEDDWTWWPHRPRESNSSKQANGRDCGVYTCFNAFARVRGLVPKEAFGHNDMVYARHNIAATLLHGSMTGDFDWEG